MQINFNTSTLKKQVEDNPLVAAGIGAAILNGAARLLNANTARKNANTWAKEVARRVKTK